MELTGKRASTGVARTASARPEVVEDFLTLDAEAFSEFLVGKTIEVVDPTGEEPLHFTGIVRQQENAEREAVCFCLLWAKWAQLRQGRENGRNITFKLALMSVEKLWWSV
jgi:hypothetical protein